MISFTIQEIFDNLKKTSDLSESKKNEVINFLRKVLHLQQNLSELKEKPAIEMQQHQKIRLKYMISNLSQEQDKWINSLKPSEKEEFARIVDKLGKIVSEITLAHCEVATKSIVRSTSLDIMNQDPEILTAASMKEVIDLTPKFNMSALAERDISYNENSRGAEK